MPLYNCREGRKCPLGASVNLSFDFFGHFECLSCLWWHRNSRAHPLCQSSFSVFPSGYRMVLCKPSKVVVGVCLDGVSKVIVSLALLHNVLSHAAGCQSDSELLCVSLHHSGKRSQGTHPALMNELSVAQLVWYRCTGVMGPCNPHSFIPRSSIPHQKSCSAEQQ